MEDSGDPLHVLDRRGCPQRVCFITVRRRLKRAMPTSCWTQAGQEDSVRSDRYCGSTVTGFRESPRHKHLAGYEFLIGSAPQGENMRASHTDRGPRNRRWAQRVLTRPLVVFAAVAALLIVLAVPALGVTMDGGFDGCLWRASATDSQVGAWASSATYDRNGGCQNLDADTKYKSSAGDVYTKWCSAQNVSVRVCTANVVPPGSTWIVHEQSRSQMQSWEHGWWANTGWWA